MLHGSARRGPDPRAAAADDVADPVQGLLRASGAGGVARALRGRAVERQPAQVDAGDARPRDRSTGLSNPPAFHHARAVVGGTPVAGPASATAGAPGRAAAR